MNTSHSILQLSARLFVIALVLILAAGAQPAAAQAPDPQTVCGGMPECGYILMHMQPAASPLPDCGGLPECGYIQMHELGSDFHTAVTVVPLPKPGIPVTGLCEPLYVGLGYHLCGASLTYGQ